MTKRNTITYIPFEIVERDYIHKNRVREAIDKAKNKVNIKLFHIILNEMKKDLDLKEK